MEGRIFSRDNSARRVPHSYRNSVRGTHFFHLNFATNNNASHRPMGEQPIYRVFFVGMVSARSRFPVGSSDPVRVFRIRELYHIHRGGRKRFGPLTFISKRSLCNVSFNEHKGYLGVFLHPPWMFRRKGRTICYNKISYLYRFVRKGSVKFTNNTIERSHRP